MPGQRPRPTWILHFTHLDNLAAIVDHGLSSDTSVQSSGHLVVEAGNMGIKSRRRNRVVDLSPGGTVADYTPFYFAPRSPMLFSLHKGNVPTFCEDTRDLIYLATTTEALAEQELTLIVSDRNAVLDYATMAYEPDCDDLVDWDLMNVRYWADTAEDPDRRERRMAECLVWEPVEFTNFSVIVVHGKTQYDVVTSLLRKLGVSDADCSVQINRDWYF